MIHRRAPWKTKASVKLATLEWVSWFNHHRLLEPIGYLPRAEAEANYYKRLTQQPLKPGLPVRRFILEHRCDVPHQQIGEQVLSRKHSVSGIYSEGCHRSFE